MLKAAQSGREDGSVIAMKLLGFLAEDADLLGRFMSLSGLSPDDLRRGIADPAFQAGVLDFVLSDESLLLAFAANAGIDPAAVMKARTKMPGFAYDA